MRKKSLLVALATIASSTSFAGVGDLLISEVKVGPTAGEFIEIYNNGQDTVDLSDVYLTDGTRSSLGKFYYNMPTGANMGGGLSKCTDFHVKFPQGSMLSSNTYITVSIDGSASFTTDGGFSEQPTYELVDDGDGIATAMSEVVPGSIGETIPGDNLCDFGPTLSGGGEVLVLYYWDGTSDLVKDIDYVLWGDKAEGVDKSGVAVDGPDPGTAPSLFASDAPIGTSSGDPNCDSTSGQEVLPSFFCSHDNALSWQRTDLTEGNETKFGGNGFSGDNEMTEDFSATWTADNAPTPNTGDSSNVVPPIVINEVDAVTTDGADFVELYDGGAGNTSLDNVQLALFEGDDDSIVTVINLTGHSTDNNGYFLLGDASLTPDYELINDSLGNGADAVALYYAAGFISGVSTDNLVDALVYDSGQADDSGLMVLMNPGQAQVNEDSNGTVNANSNARCPNGSGGGRNSASYMQVIPTPGTMNNLCPTGDYYQAVNPTVENNPTLLKSTLHDIIDDHVAGSYSFAWVILAEADEDPVNSNAVRMVYSNESLTWNGGGNQDYNREHTWPQSYGFHGDNSGFGSNNAARTDAHHLMLSNKNYNSRRGNAYFDNCTSGCNNTDLTTVANHGVGGSSSRGDSNWRDGSDPDVFEPWDFRKGDIARAMFYMDVRYSGDVANEADLELTDNTNLISTGNRYMGKLSTLCEWHIADPVDSIEQQRNEVVFSHQNNRNPFIDHPEWVAKVFTVCASVTPQEQPIFKNGFE